MSHNSQQQQQPFNSNENRYISHRDREQYKNFRRGKRNRTRILTTPSPTMSHLNLANRFPHFSHNTPEAFNTCKGNNNFQNYTYHATQIRDHATNSTPFRSMNISQEQQGFYQKGSPRSNSFPCECYNNVSHNSNISTNHPEKIPNSHGKGKILGHSFIICYDGANSNPNSSIFSSYL